MSNRLESHQPGQAKAKADSKPFNPFAAADQNTLEWAEELAQIGLSIVAVELVPSDCLWTQTEFAEQELGPALDAAGLGRFDSARWTPKMWFYFYVPPKRLPAALEFIRKGLDARKLLSTARIGYADPDDGQWRIFHPGAEGAPGQ
jgi:hypothetical protein